MPLASCDSRFRRGIREIGGEVGCVEKRNPAQPVIPGFINPAYGLMEIITVNKIDIVDEFLAQAKTRSSENSEAFALLFERKFYGVAIGLLRQELDTLIRLSYLWLPETPLDIGLALIEKSVNGEKWKKINHKNKEMILTDKDMLELANHLGGWEKVIYSIGCKLIHLSDYHLYYKNDPFNKITLESKNEIISYLKNYHKYSENNINFELLLEYLPLVMKKLVDNIDCFIELLRAKYSEPSQ